MVSSIKSAGSGFGSSAPTGKGGPSNTTDSKCSFMICSWMSNEGIWCTEFRVMVVFQLFVF